MKALVILFVIFIAATEPTPAQTSAPNNAAQPVYLSLASFSNAPGSTKMTGPGGRSLYVSIQPLLTLDDIQSASTSSRTSGAKIDAVRVRLTPRGSSKLSTALPDMKKSALVLVHGQSLAADEVEIAPYQVKDSLTIKGRFSDEEFREIQRLLIPYGQRLEGNTLVAIRVPADPAKSQSPEQTRPQSTPSSNQPMDINTATLEELDTLPGVGKYTSEQIIKIRPINSLDVLLSIKGMDRDEVAALEKLVTFGGTAPTPPQPEVSATPVPPPPIPTDAPPASAKAGPKILFVPGSNSINQVDQILIKELEKAGYDVKLASKAGFALSYKRSQPSGPFDTIEVLDPVLGKATPDVLIGVAHNTRMPEGAATWDDSQMKEYAGFVFSQPDRCAKLPLPFDKIRSSGKAVVYTEVRSIKVGQEFLAGDLTGSQKSGVKVKPFGIEASFREVAFNVLNATRKAEAEFPQDSEIEVFITEKLIPRIKQAVR